MRGRLPVALLLAIGVVPAACASPERAPRVADAAHADTRATVRGYAQFGGAVQQLTPCDSTGPLRVADPDRALWGPYRELAPDPTDTSGLFAVVEARLEPPPADAADDVYAGTLTVERVLYLAREGYGCAAPWSRFAFRAFGNEPFWSLTVAGDSITLIRPDTAERTWHAAVRAGVPGGFTISSGNPASGGVSVRFSGAPCRDTMAGSYFGYAAVARLGGDSLTGCALAGGGR